MNKRAFMSRPDMSMAERLAARIEVDPETGCHNWTATTVRGYGKLWDPGAGQNRLTHRIAYELAHGKIPEGFHVDHLCKNTRCCNPAHLEAVTPAENNRRSTSPTALSMQKTHCAQGHPYDAENTFWKGGQRRCRICVSRWNRQNKERRKARQPAEKPAKPNGTTP